MKVKVKIQDKQKRFIKNNGMHLLSNFILRDEIKEIDLKESEMFILDSAEFKAWFELDGAIQEPEVIDEIVEVDDIEETESLGLVDEHNTIEELRQYCKDQNFKGYTGMSKGELIVAINSGSLEVKDED